jgi:hypothetical protein
VGGRVDGWVGGCFPFTQLPNQTNRPQPTQIRAATLATGPLFLHLSVLEDPAKPRTKPALVAPLRVEARGFGDAGSEVGGASPSYPVLCCVIRAGSVVVFCRNRALLTSILQCSLTSPPPQTSRPQVSKETFDDLDEVLARFVEPLVARYKEVMSNRKFRDGTRDEVDATVEADALQAPNVVGFVFLGGGGRSWLGVTWRLDPDSVAWLRWAAGLPNRPACTLSFSPLPKHPTLPNPTQPLNPATPQPQPIYCISLDPERPLSGRLTFKLPGSRSRPHHEPFVLLPTGVFFRRKLLPSVEHTLSAFKRVGFFLGGLYLSHRTYCTLMYVSSDCCKFRNLQEQRTDQLNRPNKRSKPPGS